MPPLSDPLRSSRNPMAGPLGYAVARERRSHCVSEAGHSDEQTVLHPEWNVSQGRARGACPLPAQMARKG